MELEDIKRQLESYRMKEFVDTFFDNDDTHIRELALEMKFEDLSFGEDVLQIALKRVINKFDILVNQRLLKDLAKSMNAYTDDRNKFSFKTEFVYKALYFVTKKVYGEYAIFKEGVPVNVISTKRIGIRTDVPTLSNDMLIDLLKTVFLVQGRKDLLMKRISYWKQKFIRKIKERSIDILVPCGMNKKLEDYKTMNDCVRGMLLYNTLTNTETFKTGTKGYKVYVSNIRFDKLGLDVNAYSNRINKFVKDYNVKNRKQVSNIIVIPIESKTVPDWIEIDFATTMDKIFYSRVNELLQGMGMMIGEKQQVSIDDLF